MKDHNNDKKRVSQYVERMHSLGLEVKAKHNKYNNYDFIQLWALGLGTLDNNHDVRDYDPKKYTGTELLVLVFQNKFKDIGGPGIHVDEYLKLIHKHYPENIDYVLSLTLASRYTDSMLTPVTITDTHHPSLESLIQTATDDSNTDNDFTDKQLLSVWEIINKAVGDLIFEIQLIGINTKAA